jgi:hypothetical protein
MIVSVLVFGTLSITGAPDRARAAAPEAARDFIKVLSDEAVSVIADPSMARVAPALRPRIRHAHDWPVRSRAPLARCQRAAAE